MADVPKIKYNGREITPAPVKMRVWRELLQDGDAEGTMDIGARMEYYLTAICKVFGRDEITPDVLQDILTVDEVIPLYSACAQYVFGLAVSRLDKLPNVETPTA